MTERIRQTFKEEHQGRYYEVVEDVWFEQVIHEDEDGVSWIETIPYSEEISRTEIIPLDYDQEIEDIKIRLNSLEAQVTNISKLVIKLSSE